MQRKARSPSPQGTVQAAASGAADTDSMVKEVQGLVWALIDDRITPTQFVRLEQLVTQDAAARAVYVRAMHLHADLQARFAARPGGQSGDQRPPIAPLVTDLFPTPDARPSVPDA